MFGEIVAITLRRRPTRRAWLKRSAKVHILGRAHGRISSIRCGLLIRLCVNLYHTSQDGGRLLQGLVLQKPGKCKHIQASKTVHRLLGC